MTGDAVTGPYVVGIGGGHGLAATLRAARLYAGRVSAVVTVADDGGSSGRLTRELGIPPPGDIRNCLVALSDRDQIKEMFQHRFESGPLTGHTIGNLIIASLTEMKGDFAEAVASAADLLSARGEVFPATTRLVRLGARTSGGDIKGQVAVAQTTAPIEAVYLDPPDTPAHEPAVAAIRGADQVVLGPGSVFTSLIATLSVPGIGAAVRETSARRVFVCNSRMQKGETEGMNASALLGALLAHAGPGCVDSVVVQAPSLPGDGVEADLEGLRSLGVDVIPADVANPDGGHDPERLAEALRRA